MKRFLSPLFVALILLSSFHGYADAASGQTVDRTGVEETFDRNKGALYALYGRALRENPAIKGKIVFDIDIAASGEVTDCRMKYSELNAPDLEAKLRARIKLMRFPPRNAPITIAKPIDFFPAA